MRMNLRADSTFVEDAGWHAAAQRYEAFLRGHRDAKVLFLEIAVGYNTPGIIKIPFWKMTAQWPDAVYACLNADAAYVPEEILPGSILIRSDAGEALDLL